MSQDIPGQLRPGILRSVSTSTGLSQNVLGYPRIFTYQDVSVFPGTLSVVLLPTRCVRRPRMSMNVLASIYNLDLGKSGGSPGSIIPE